MMEKYPGIEDTELFNIMQVCMQERISKSTENEFTFPDNSKGCFELKTEPVPKGIFILSMDISEREKHELEKEKHIQGLQTMITMTSHRVRQPIASILGVSNLLDNENLAVEELNRIVSYMKESALNLDAFTKELTTFIHEQKLNIK